MPQNRCKYETLVSKISYLSDANKMIPAILAANKEAVITSSQFQILLRQADKAQEILLEVLASKGELGEEIKNEYLGRVNEWVKEHFSQGTEPQKQDTENSTLSETEGNPSTEETTLGENSQPIS